MNAIQTQQSEFPVETVIRVAAAAATLVGVFVLGYSAPVDRVFAQDATPAVLENAAELAADNGPTGYFPDMFEDAARAAEPVEPIETF